MQPPGPVPLFLRDKAAVPSGLMARRAAIEAVGGFEDTFRGEYEDQVFCVKMCVKAPVLPAGRCWYRYRQHPDSCVVRGQLTGQTHAARLRFLTWLAAHIAEQRIGGWKLRWALAVELWRCRHPEAVRSLDRTRGLVERLTSRLARQGAGR
jgi:hypothetical protein